MVLPNTDPPIAEGIDAAIRVAKRGIRLLMIRWRGRQWRRWFAGRDAIQALVSEVAQISHFSRHQGGPPPYSWTRVRALNGSGFMSVIVPSGCRRTRT